MPRFAVGKLEEALDPQQKTSLGQSRILLLGLAYKKNVSDIRESPSLRLIEPLERRGAEVTFHDPHVAIIANTREYPKLAGRKLAAIDQISLAGYHAVVIATDHDCIDYEMIARHSRLIVDTRNAMAKKKLSGFHIVKA